MDSLYFERRLDVIESRLDDLCGLLGEVLEGLGVDSVQSKPTHPALVALPTLLPSCHDLEFEPDNG